MQEGVSEVSIHTIDTVKRDFYLIRDEKGFHNSMVFANQEGFCDIYFEARTGDVTQNQVDAFNSFVENWRIYLLDLQSLMDKRLSLNDQRLADRVRFKPLLFDVLEVPLDSSAHDLVLTCSKKYRWLLWRRYASITVRFKEGKILNVT